MPKCSIKGCESKTNVKVPKNDHQFELWKKALKRTRVSKRENLRVCEDHFDESDFERDLQSELQNVVKIKRIKLTAIPRVNLGEIVDAGCVSSNIDLIF